MLRFPSQPLLRAGLLRATCREPLDPTCAECGGPRLDTASPCPTCFGTEPPIFACATCRQAVAVADNQVERPCLSTQAYDADPGRAPAFSQPDEMLWGVKLKRRGALEVVRDADLRRRLADGELPGTVLVSRDWGATFAPANTAPEFPAALFVDRLDRLSERYDTLRQQQSDAWHNNHCDDEARLPRIELPEPPPPSATARARLRASRSRRRIAYSIIAASTILIAVSARRDGYVVHAIVVNCSLGLLAARAKVASTHDGEFAKAQTRWEQVTRDWAELTDAGWPFKPIQFGNPIASKTGYADIVEKALALRKSREGFEEAIYEDAVEQALADLRAARDALPHDRAQLLEEAALNDQLARFRIADAGLPGIGAEKIATLAAHGIATAGDVAEDDILAIPGFGPAMAAKLLAWRKRLARRHRPGPDTDAPAAEIERIDRQIGARRRELEVFETGLIAAVERLEADFAAGEKRHAELLREAGDAGQALVQARADAAIAPREAVNLTRLIMVTCLMLALAWLLA